MARLQVAVILAFLIAAMLPASSEGGGLPPQHKGKSIILKKPKFEIPSIEMPAYEPKNIIPCSKKAAKVTLAPGESATFQSPNYPGNYGGKSKCKWQFKSEEDITIVCYEFELEPANRRGKCKDKLKIGRDIFCGSSTPFYEGGTTIKVQFKSNKKRNFKGFSCTAIANSPPSPPSGPCNCGRANHVTRIVGGVETEVNEYPWMAALILAGTSQVFCGASVVFSDLILTAAHCTQAILDYGISYQVLAGAHSLTDPASSELRLNPDSIVQHPDYDGDHLGVGIPNNDIAFILLLESIDFDACVVRPVCLPTAETYDDVLATVAGWGTLEAGGDQPDVLMEVNVPTMSNSVCQEIYGELIGDGVITDTMICAGFEEGGKDACQGDSGGPLFYNPGSGYTQIGIVSWGIGCGEPNFPGVYSRVASLLARISSNITARTTCPPAS